MIYNRNNFFKSPPAGFDGEFDWDFLDGAFGEKIKPMDIDGMVERNGYFLIFETKDEDKDIPLGQKITLRALHKTGVFTIIFLQGKDKKDFTRMVVAEMDGTKKEIELGDNPKTTIYNYCKSWFDLVNSFQN